MVDKDLMERLEELLEEESRLKQNGNWGSPMRGHGGNYALYSIRFDDKNNSTQLILIKEYEGGRYSVLMDKQYEPKNLDEVIELIPKFLPK